MAKPTIEERRQNNIDKGRPAHSFFRWTESDNVLLEKNFNNGLSIEEMATKFERAPESIALQLIKLKLMEPDK